MHRRWQHDAPVFPTPGPTKATGIRDAAAVGRVTIVDGEPATTPPPWCDLILTTAFASEAVYDEEGNVTTPAKLAPGAWFLASIQGGEPPELIEPRIVARWSADEPMPLPEGVVAISPVLSGMVLS